MSVKQGGAPANQRIAFSDLRAQVSFLSQLFRGEFIFPTEGLNFNLSKTLGLLETDNVIKVARSNEPSRSASDAMGPSEAGRGEVDWVEISDQEREQGRENFDFYCFLIWPFIEAAWLGAVSLLMLTPPAGREAADSWLPLKAVQDRAQLLGKTLYHQGDLSYFEAVNKETLKNTYQRFEEEGMILVAKSKDKNTAATIRLAGEWLPRRDSNGEVKAEGALWMFAERISASRREGKNRRDGATVQRRVLSLADRVGAELWEGGKGAGAGARDREAERAATKAQSRRGKTKLAVPASRL
jgi:hypothetical protein